MSKPAITFLGGIIVFSCIHLFTLCTHQKTEKPMKDMGDTPSSSLIVAGAQIVVTGDVQQNINNIKRAIDFAKNKNVDILLTPEGALSGYTTDFDSTEVSKAMHLIRDYAREAGVALALGVCTYENGYEKPFNQLRLYGRDGTFLGFHSKILRCTNMKNPEPGQEEIDLYETSELLTFQVQQTIIGTLVCNDLWANPEWTSMPDPHLTRQLSEMGAAIILHSTNTGTNVPEWAEVYQQFHRNNLRMRARVSKIWIVSVDAAVGDGNPCLNPSCVIDPNGQVKLEVSPVGEQMFTYTIQL